jgi:hypothetical protein
LGPVVTARLKNFTPQDFAQALWAFATVESQYQVNNTTAGSGVQLAQLLCGCFSGSSKA